MDTREGSGSISPANENLELAWAAGFFDGEGCTVCSDSGCFSVSVSQVFRPNLERFKRALGGVGSIQRARTPTDGVSKKAISKWTVSGLVARSVIDKLWPLLSGDKQHQALLAINSWSFRKINKSTLNPFCVNGLHARPYRSKKDGTCLSCRDIRNAGMAPKKRNIYARDLLREWTDDDDWQRVKPDITTALAAQSWIHGLAKPEDYNPAIRT